MQLLWYFWIYSFLGWILERAYAFLVQSGRQERRCLLLLPLCPVYGLGMLAVLALPPMGWLSLVFWGGVMATAAEYGVHWACETFLGVRFWDYSGVPGNVGGRVCLPFTLAWGPLTAAAVRFIQPGLTSLSVPPALSWLFLLLFTADCVCSVQFLRTTRSVNALRSWNGALSSKRSERGRI